MKNFDNALQIFSLTRKDNCRKCGRPTCLAFTGAVFTGTRKLRDCHYVSVDMLEQYGEGNTEDTVIEENITLP